MELLTQKGAMVVELWVGDEGMGAWNLRFIRPFNDWELETVHVFIGVLNISSISPHLKDKMIWKGDSSGCFTIKAYFNFLEGESPWPAPIKILWNHYAPSKVGFFTWEAWWGKVLTTTQLKKRGFHLVSKCPFCGKEEEELEHILIHCPLIWG